MSRLEKMVQIAAEAADLVMKVYATEFLVDYKGPADPVTDADREANELICRRLGEEFPDVPIVAEESPERDWAEFRRSERIFFVDPVDGTREFVERNGQFVVMIGLVEGTRPVAGVLHAPALRHVWAGEVGRGAFFVDERAIRRPLAPLLDKPLRHATIVGSPHDAARLSDAELGQLGSPISIGPHPISIGPHPISTGPRHISMGSAGLKAACVADGRADVYFAKTKAGCLWDTCAPEAILAALGGVFTDARGQHLDYRGAEIAQNRGAIAAAPGLHAEVLARVAAS